MIVKIPDVEWIVDFLNLQKKLSINVPLFVDSLVGNVICRKKLSEISV